MVVVVVVGNAPFCRSILFLCEDIRISHILAQSFKYFGPGAHPELRKPPDPFEFSIRRNLGNLVCRSGQKLYREIILRKYYKSPSLVLERHFTDPGKIC